MIEYLNITLQLTVLIFFSFFPVNNFTANYFLLSFKNLKLINYFIINNLLLIVFLLIMSFTKIEMIITFYSILTFYLILFVLSIKNLSKYLIKDNLLIVIIFLLVNFALFFDVARDLHLAWDALELWKVKANNFYLGSNYFDVNEVKYPQYPHLGTYIWAFFWKSSLLDIEYFGRLHQTYIYVLSLFAISLSFKCNNILKNFFIIILLIVLTYNPSLRGYQDIYIFSLISFFGYFIYQKIRFNKKINDFIILIPIILPWIKNEGIFYTIFLMFIYCILQKDLFKRFVFSFLVIFLILAQFYMNIYYFNLNNIFQVDIDLSNITNDQGFLFIVQKIYKIFFYSAHAFFKNPILIIDLLIIIACFYLTKFHKDNLPFFTFLAFNIAFIFAIYLLTPADIKWHLQTSIDRLLLQTSALYIYMLAILKDKKFFKI